VRGLESGLEELERGVEKGAESGCFEWVNSLLLKALLGGEWVVVEGANRCSAAVLDRLNSLLEPEGALFLSERGATEGKVLEIRPHPDFRLILTLDPASGEISRCPAHVKSAQVLEIQTNLPTLFQGHAESRGRDLRPWTRRAHSPSPQRKGP
jgi:midasin (ATPase involved in ribosome maturation)